MYTIKSFAICLISNNPIDFQYLDTIIFFRVKIESSHCKHHKLGTCNLFVAENNTENSNYSENHYYKRKCYAEKISVLFQFNFQCCLCLT